jgi:three-Cys-motif partner protein
MAKSNDPFFDYVRSWSKRKHRLLAKYLTPFSAKLGSWNDLICCVDGFAGEGKYKDDNEGSPLIMARLSDECAGWQKPVNLRLINVESKQSNYRNLCQHTQAWEHKGVVTNLYGDFCSLVPKVLSKIGNAPAFFFIDPYGPTSVRFASLLPILERSQRVTELIINFNAVGLRRVADTLHSNAHTDRAIKARDTNAVNVSEILGSDRWRAQFEINNLTTQQRETFLVNEYMENLSRYGFNVVRYGIRKSINHSPKYYLVFCTRHNDGVTLMNSFVREEEDQLFMETVTNPIQPSLFDPLKEEIQGRREELKRMISEYLKGSRQTTRRRIKRHFIFQRFGDFHDKDYHAVVQELVNEGELQTGHGKKRFNEDEPLTYTPSSMKELSYAYHSS